MRSKAGFTLTELVVVVAILLIVSGLSLPSISRTLDYATLNSAAQQVASVYEQARMRATQDDNYYTVLASQPGAVSQLCIDMDGDSQCGNAEPQMQLPNKISLNNGGVPVPLTAATLGFAAVQTENSATYGQQGNQTSGLAWNSRGLPCQRLSATSTCSNLLPAGPVAWVQYLQLRRSPNDVLYAAVTVNPSGRIRIWKYAPVNGGASWF